MSSPEALSVCSSVWMLSVVESFSVDALCGSETLPPRHPSCCGPMRTAACAKEQSQPAEAWVSSRLCPRISKEPGSGPRVGCRHCSSTGVIDWVSVGRLSWTSSRPPLIHQFIQTSGKACFQMGHIVPIHVGRKGGVKEGDRGRSMASPRQSRILTSAQTAIWGSKGFGWFCEEQLHPGNWD
uniref:Secreted protein n=1 Tax=Knipowitschia caucasica TaxID=637954 RepID=A0AAV2KEC0_KNICA